MIILFSAMAYTGTEKNSVSTELSLTISDLQSEVCSLKEELMQNKEQLALVEKGIQDPYILAHKYKSDRVAYKDFLRKEKEYPSTPFKLHPQIKNADVSTEMLAAMIAFGQDSTSPQEYLYVNSATRKGNPFSHHYSGNAIDINVKSAEAFLNWVSTDRGKEWLEKYQLTFYIEDNHSGSKFLAAWRQMKDFVFMNPKSTGPHVHIAYVGRKNKFIEKS